MVERHRNAQPVLGGEIHAGGHLIGIVDDVAVRQRRALRRAGRAGGELDIDRIGRFQAGRDPVQLLMLRRTGRGQDIAEIEHAVRVVVAHADDGFQVGQVGRRQPARLGVRQLRAPASAACRDSRMS